MEPDEGTNELQAYISNLVSALGGVDVTSAKEQYKLGDEALGCLRDVKKWLQLYDAKLDRWDVARAISETTLVDQDIVEILSQWQLAKQGSKQTNIDDRIALACLEILVPVTWPVNLDKDSSANHWHHAPSLKNAQIRYKKAILSDPRHGVLKAVIRLAAKPLSTSLSDRTNQDEGILRLAMSFFKNILAIGTVKGGDVDESRCILEFKRQKVLQFFITFGAGIGSTFNQQDTLLLECLYLLMRGVDFSRLFITDKEQESLTSQDLQGMLNIEKDLRKSWFHPSRHSRFGTLVSLELGGSSQSRVTVSGQQAITKNTNDTLEYIDQSKKWRKSQRNMIDERENWNVAVNLDPDARKALANFVSQFLDAAFNPTFIRIRRLIERDNERIQDRHLVYYLVLVGSFLQSLRERPGAIDFQLVGGCLNRETIVVAMTLMRRGLEPGAFQSNDLVHSSMICFRNILLMIELMGHNANVELRDIADSMKAQVFYEEEWLTTLAQLPHFSKKVTLAYACESVELTHVLLKALDAYSKQHTYVYVKSQRRRRAKKKKQRQSGDSTESTAPIEDDPVPSDEEGMVMEAARVTHERKFEFQKFVSKYASTKVLDTYDRILANFRDVKDFHLKHVFGFFLRLMSKPGYRVLLYNLTLIRLITRLTSSREGLPLESPVRHIAEQFLRYYTPKLLRALQHNRLLYVELLFDKMPEDLLYFETGEDPKASYTPTRFRHDLIDRNLPIDRKYAVVVASLIDRNSREILEKVETELSKVAIDQTSNSIRPFTTDKSLTKAILNDPLLRLLLHLAGLVFTPKAVLIPKDFDELKVIEACQYIARFKSETVEFEQGKEAFDYLITIHDALDPDVPPPPESVHYRESIRDFEEGSDDPDELRFADPRLQPLSAEEKKARELEKRQARKKAKEAKEAKEAKQARLKKRRDTGEDLFVLSDNEDGEVPDELIRLADKAMSNASPDQLSEDESHMTSSTTNATSTSPDNTQREPNAKRQRLMIDDDSD